MKAFEYFKVTSVKQAVALLAKYGEKAALLAGGSDLLGMMKDRQEGPKLKMPKYVIGIKGIGDLSSIKEQKKGAKIGAAATITEIISSELLARKYPVLVQAARQVAVPQIRNVATLGGNLCQRPRCWYFRGRLFDKCLRKGGEYCYAPGGENQYHAILGASRCYMVYPSDLAPALISLNARVEIAGPKGTRMTPLERFYIHPEKNILRENILTPQEMVVSVELPDPGPAGRGTYLKLKERQAFDFALVSAAVVLNMKNDVVADSRVVFGGIAPFPYRSARAEAALKGKGVKDAIAAASKAATDGAEPLSGNGYKVDAARGLLEKALESLA
jgi:xanthine dehydrogenase YagS FAD-binding subunit